MIFSDKWKTQRSRRRRIKMTKSNTQITVENGARGKFIKDFTSLEVNVCSYACHSSCYLLIVNGIRMTTSDASTAAYNNNNNSSSRNKYLTKRLPQRWQLITATSSCKDCFWHIEDMPRVFCQWRAMARPVLRMAQHRAIDSNNNICQRNKVEFLIKNCFFFVCFFLQVPPSESHVCFCVCGGPAKPQNCFILLSVMMLLGHLAF